MKKQRLTQDEKKFFPISKNSNVKYEKGKIYEYTVDENKLNSLRKLFFGPYYFYGTRVYNISVSYKFALTLDLPHDVYISFDKDGNTKCTYSITDENLVSYKDERIVDKTETLNILQKNIWIVNNKLKSNDKDLLLKFIDEFVLDEEYIFSLFDNIK